MLFWGEGNSFKDLKHVGDRQFRDVIMVPPRTREQKPYLSFIENGGGQYKEPSEHLA